MPSSASKGTQKKNLKKKLAKQEAGQGSDGQPVQATQRGQKKVKKGKKGETRKKQYIAPVKPARAVVDPVDLYGLGVAGDSAVDADVIISLRKLAKKDENTIARGLDELQTWVESLKSSESDTSQILAALPVWVSSSRCYIGALLNCSLDLSIPEPLSACITSYSIINSSSTSSSTILR